MNAILVAERERTAIPIKRGRYIEAVEISWEPKPDPTEVKRELDRPKVGRKARREGTGETPIVHRTMG